MVRDFLLKSDESDRSDESDKSDESDRSDKSDRSDYYLMTFLAPLSSRIMRSPEVGMSLMRKVLLGAV